jgi:sarcosine oxidase
MGAATCYYLAKRGRSVLGLDRFTPPHSKGSHGGQSRIIRKAYFEHPDYVPLLERAYLNWRSLEEECGQQLYFETGMYYAGPKGNRILQGVRTAAAEHGIPLEVLHHNPAGIFRLPADYEMLFEPEAGFLLCEDAISMYRKLALEAGVQFRDESPVRDWRTSGGGVEVVTDEGIFTADRLVITAGARAGQLLPEIAGKLKVTKQLMAWFRTDGSERYRTGHFPCWLIADTKSTGAYYGFPAEDGAADEIKVALHLPGEVVDPDREDRTLSDLEVTKLRQFVAAHLPDIDPEPVRMEICLYENSPDEHFVIDRLKGSEDKVCYAWGFSGHGFKFASATGEILADLSMRGRTDLPVGFLEAGRFSRK